MERNEPLEAVDQQFLFSMALVCVDEIYSCRVYAARLADGTQFTRVVSEEGACERVIDVDYWEEVGWIDMWYGEPSPWSALVGPALDYHIAGNKKK
jgi:hypothetical protein